MKNVNMSGLTIKITLQKSSKQIIVTKQRPVYEQCLTN